MINSAELFGSDVDVDADLVDPLDLLDRWLAPVGAGGDANSTPLMALATLDAEGYPRNRHVLLSAYDRGRLHFHTDVTSAKAQQLTAHPRAGATIVWPDVARQLSVSGTVSIETAEEQAGAFSRRTRYLQILAWINDQRLTRLPITERERVWAEFDATHPVLEPPPTWTGYVLVAERITFWRGFGDSPSQRVACRRTPEGWTIERLPG